MLLHANLFAILHANLIIIFLVKYIIRFFYEVCAPAYNIVRLKTEEKVNKVAEIFVTSEDQPSGCYLKWS